MTMQIHHLKGCAPAPLAHYLKALGILRLVAEQADPQARGWWQDEHFCLMTKLDRNALEQFFLNDYEPTPFVSPWNKGSGFYYQADPPLAMLETSTAKRFAAWRKGIADARANLGAIQQADAKVRELKDKTKSRKTMSGPEKAAARALKDDPAFKAQLNHAQKKFKKLKSQLFTPMQLNWRGPHRAWMDSALVLDEKGKPNFPSLLGTGGNDGRLDYTNNAMQRLGELFDLSAAGGEPRPQTQSQLAHALWSTPCHAQISCAIGQFLPGGAGGANSTTAADGDSLVNPWDFILMLEGTIPFSSRITRRFDPQSLSSVSAPFAMRAHAAGFYSPGDEKDQRGEQWMPLWSRPSTLGDVSAMVGEGRLDVGRRVAHRPLDAARAVARLGVARGVDAFTRYGYLERNGQSNLAVSLGRIVVHPRPHTRLIDDIAPWLDRLHRLARGKLAPARLVHAERRLADAVFGVLTHDETAERWQSVLRAMVAVEAIQAGGTAVVDEYGNNNIGPIPRLNPHWIKVAAEAGSTEVRLAVALGSAAGRYRRNDGRAYPVDPVRHHWLPLENGARRFQVHDKRLAQDRRVVMHGRDPLSDLVSLVERRLIESTMGDQEQRRLPLVTAWGCDASLTDLAEVIAGHVDLPRTSELARAFMAVDWPRLNREDLPLKPSHREQPEFDEVWLALRLASLPWPLDENHDIRVGPAMIRRLTAGDGAGAVTIALRRLRFVGLRPPIQAAFTDPSTARLWVAALAFPISRFTAQRAAKILDPSYSRRPS